MSDVEFTTADRFITELTDKKYRDAQLRWLFRGVKDASYPLLPVSHRQGKHCPVDPEPTTNREQAWCEHQSLWRFFEASHREGLQIPNWHETRLWLKSRGEMLKDGRVATGSSRPESATAFIAIAQHHGTPTRLLDWTRDPLVAAYFAVSQLEAKEERVETHKVAVWALDTDIYRAQTIEVPYDLNQNARAQRGVFIDCISVAALEWFDSPGSGSVFRKPFDEYLKEYPSDKNAVHKFTLPGSAAAALMHELHLNRIDGASLFPGYAGAARAERERRWWEPQAVGSYP